jgi:hypothetical protein
MRLPVAARLLVSAVRALASNNLGIVPIVLHGLADGAWKSPDAATTKISPWRLASQWKSPDGPTVGSTACRNPHTHFLEMPRISVARRAASAARYNLQGVLQVLACLSKETSENGAALMRMSCRALEVKVAKPILQCSLRYSCPEHKLEDGARRTDC